MCASFPVLGTHRRHFGLHTLRKGTDSWTHIVLWKLLSHGDLRREHKGGIEEGGKERENPPSYGIHSG
ncbi:hypothetical protein XELAEV_18045158mg [Xenopus laevis]|uniref:Uncharacterized protein n=1 Tax=Xenopus laevis TaxID=8355 RepID=A0A974C0F6_XENLA|nr:hypothetical protein XELAEV_18045158mg [Xenopus laevis]